MFDFGSSQKMYSSNKKYPPLLHSVCIDEQGMSMQAKLRERHRHIPALCYLCN